MQAQSTGTAGKKTDRNVAAGAGDEIFTIQADVFRGRRKDATMPIKSGGKDNGRIDLLRQREAALKAAIAAEKVRQQKRREKDAARESAVIGEALVRYTGRSADFRLMLKQVLGAAGIE